MSSKEYSMSSFSKHYSAQNMYNFVHNCLNNNDSIDNDIIS